MTTDQCRSDDEIHKLALGMLSEAEAAVALAHIESCPKCESRLIAAEGNPNPIFTSLRHGKPSSPAPKRLPVDRSPLWEYRAAYWSLIVCVIAIAAAIVFGPRRSAVDPRVAEVMVQIRAANPQFDGDFIARLGDDGKTLELQFASDDVSNLSPLRRLSGPLSLRIAARNPGGKLADIAPLAGLDLLELDVRNCRVDDFTPLQQTPVQRLWADIHPPRDAAALRKAASLRTINDRALSDALSAETKP